MAQPTVLMTKLLTVIGLMALPSTLSGQDSAKTDFIKKGQYVLRAAGGCTCHQNPNVQEFSLSGGRPIETPFGTIYGTNITPDPETGIGNFSDEDFVKAMREGIGPDGVLYYPVFPFTSFTKMSDIIPHTNRHSLKP